MIDTSRTMLRILTTIGLVTFGTARAEAEETFFGLGDLGGGAMSSRSWAISSDGSTIVGESQTDQGVAAFRWTQGGGMSLVEGSGIDGVRSVAYGVSENGSVIVGAFQSSATEGNRQAFRWSTETGMVGLGELSGGSGQSVAFGVSADGSVVVGTNIAPNIWGLQVPEAFRWDQQSGMVSLNVPPHAGESNRSAAHGISADGSVIAGRFTAYGMIQDFEAGSWSADEGWVNYRGPGWSDRSGQATAVSADGSVIIGSINAPPYGIDTHGFRWERSGDTDWLINDAPNETPPFISTVGQAVSADGSVVVGTYRSAGIPLDPTRMPELSPNSRAFFWDSEAGFRFLDDFLHEQGVSFAGWALLEARGVSGNGLTITGTGINPDGRFEAWVVSLEGGPRNGTIRTTPEPSSLFASAIGLSGLALVARRRGQVTR